MDPIPPTAIPPQPPIIPTPPVFTQAPVEPEPPKKSLAWLIILVIFFLLASTGVLAYQYYQLKIQVVNLAPSLTPTPVVLPQPSAETAAAAANWKIYTNDQFGFEVKYAPNNEPFEDTGPGHTPNIISFGSMKNNGFDIEISAVHNLDYYKNLITENIDNEEKVTVDGIIADKLIYKQVIVIDEFDVSQVIINMNDYDYIITALASDINQILSTFKFTN